LVLKSLLENGADVNYCRSAEEPNELLHAIFRPELLRLLLAYGLDTRTFFKDGYIARCLALSLHSFSLQWYQHIFPRIPDLLEHSRIARDHFSALNQHIETTYRMRYGITEAISSPVWATIRLSFDSPRNLKEMCRQLIRKAISTNAKSYTTQGQKLFPERVSKLEVPLCLKDYILFKT